MVGTEANSGRLIKPHRKSRAGCRNCKLRKVKKRGKPPISEPLAAKKTTNISQKCDESKPICKRCKVSAYLCNYTGNNAALELIVNDPTKLVAFDVVSFSLNPKSSRYIFNENDVDLLSRFRSRTTLTVTTDRNRGIYQNQIVEIAPSYPFLMHSLLALTSMHDRYLSGSHSRPQPASEAYHHYQSIALFNARLAKPVQPSPEESAALWVTSILLGTTTFCRIEATEEAWPLKSPSDSDLSWLVMSEGKTKLWKMTQSFTSESQFQGLIPPNIKGLVPKCSTQSDLSVLPVGLIELCNLDVVPNDKNPYHSVAATLANSMKIDYVSMLVTFLCLISNFPLEYKLLLKQKDSRALLLLAFWYAKLCEVELWWIHARASLEGHAICIFLRQFHSDDWELQNVMRTIWASLILSTRGKR